MMTIVQLLVVLVVVGLLLWLFNAYAPVAQPFKTIINVVMIVVLCVWLLDAVGLFSGGHLARPLR